MRILMLLTASAALAACAGSTPNSGGYDTADLMADYCATEGPGWVTESARVPVPSLDPDATTAGHRASSAPSTRPVISDQKRPHGC